MATIVGEGSPFTTLLDPEPLRAGVGTDSLHPWTGPVLGGGSPRVACTAAPQEGRDCSWLRTHPGRHGCAGEGTQLFISPWGIQGMAAHEDWRTEGLWAADPRADR